MLQTGGIRYNFLMTTYKGKLPPPLRPGSTSDGAAIRIEISPKDKNLPPKIGLAKIDTGGSHSQIEKKLVEELRLEPYIPSFHSNSSVENVATDTYWVYFRFPDLDAEDIFRVTAAPMHFEKFGGKSVIAVLGRDFLSICRFIYDGKAGIFKISI